MVNGKQYLILNYSPLLKVCCCQLLSYVQGKTGQVRHVMEKFNTKKNRVVQGNKSLMVIALNTYTLSRNVNTCKKIWQSGKYCCFMKVLPLLKLPRTPAQVRLCNTGKYSNRTFLYEFNHTTKSASQKIQTTKLLKHQTTFSLYFRPPGRSYPTDTFIPPFASTLLGVWTVGTPVSSTANIHSSRNFVLLSYLSV